MRFNFNLRLFKINKFLLILLIFILASLIAIFSFDLLNYLDFGKLVDYFYNNNNIEPNNQISSRDVNNVTSSLTSNGTNTNTTTTDVGEHPLVPLAIIIVLPVIVVVSVAVAAGSFFIPLWLNR